MADIGLKCFPFAINLRLLHRPPLRFLLEFGIESEQLSLKGLKGLLRLFSIENIALDGNYDQCTSGNQ